MSEEAFKIKDLETANWAFKKLKENEDEINKNKEFADNEINKIMKWLEQENKTYEDSIRYFKGLLTEYYLQLRQDDPEAKLSTPNGRVTSRKRQPKFTFDENETFKYLEKTRPDLIKTEQKFNKTEVKKILSVTDDYKVVDENGELVNFVTVLPQGDSITIKSE